MDFTKCFDKLEPLSIYNFWKRLLSALGDSRLINLETTADRNSQILFVLTLAFLICVTTLELLDPFTCARARAFAYLLSHNII